MTFIYPVILTKTQNGIWKGEFPDLEGCYTCGENLAEALYMAEEARLAAYNWIDLELQEDSPVMPYVTDIEDIEKKPGQEVRNIMVHYRYTEGWDE